MLTNIKYYDSDTVSIIANISRRPSKGPDALNLSELQIFKDSEYKQRLLDRINKILTIIKVDEKANIKFSQLSDIRFTDVNIAGIIRSIFKNDESKINFDKLSTRNKNKIKSAITEVLNEDQVLLRLLHEIQNEKPYFIPKINIDDLSKILCVRPLMKNRQIIRQDGAFLLFGMDQHKIKCPEMDKDWVVAIFEINGKRKKKIIQELEFMGISKDKVYPELEHVAHYLKDKYRF